MTTERTDWVDYAKGLGIILVVYAHLLSSGFNAGLAIPRHFFYLSDSIVYSFHMPLFFVLAGLFVQQSLKKRSIRQFLLSKLQFIAYPYLVWSVIQGITELFFVKQSHRGMEFTDLLSVPYFPLAQFWFLYALFLMYAGYAVFCICRTYTPVILSVVACVLFFFPIPTEVMALHGFSTGFLFFTLGVVLQHFSAEWKKICIPLPISSAFLILLIASSYTVFEFCIEPTRLTGGSHPFYFLFLSGLGIFSCIGFAQYLAMKKQFVFIQTLGVYSIQIYLVHMLAGVATRIILLHVFSIENPVLHMFAGVCAGLLVPIMLYKIAMAVRFPYLFTFGQASQGADD